MYLSAAKFNTAFEHAKKVVELLPKKNPENPHVSLDEIINAVKQLAGFKDVVIKYQHFSDLDIPNRDENDPIQSCLSMVNVKSKVNPKTNERERTAHISIDIDSDRTMQRFAVVHELGHILMYIPNYTYWLENSKRHTLSMYVHDDVSILIKGRKYPNNQYLFAEVLANIFAIMVLIPDSIQPHDIQNIGIEEIAKRYGVSEAAIRSRLFLSKLSNPKMNGFDFYC